MFIAIPVLNGNSVDPVQTPRSAASDLGLHCLRMSILRDARHQWVKDLFFLFSPEKEVQQFKLHFL